MDPYIGEIRIFGGNYAPQGWAFCAGQIMSIAQNTALFSLLGTTYGGNGQTTFALPDLRGRVAVGMGQGPGLSPYNEGQMGGSENVTLNANNLPAHTHTFAVQASTASADQSSPARSIPAMSNDGQGNGFNSYTKQSSNATLAPQATSPAGGSQPFNTVQPYLALNYIIALQGIFPPRS